MSKTVQISQEGKFLIGGVEIQDIDFCKDFIATLYLEDHKCYGKTGEEKVLIEAQSHPLRVQEVKEQEDSLEFCFNYQYQEEFDLKESTLFLDDWSRLCGFSKNGVPFVFSISAQTLFLDKIVEALDYNLIKYKGKELELEDWYVENQNLRDNAFWSERYQKEDIPWDKGGAHPCLDWVMPRLKLHKSKVLVAGCGRGHDVRKLSAVGHHVTGLDFSPQAVQKAQELYPQCHFVEGDVYSYAEQEPESYDLLFEHTLFCAINPADRSKLIKTWKNLLREGGNLLAVFMVSHKRNGPPFGITEWELKELLEPHFLLNYWGRLRGKETLRPGKELFVYAQKKGV